MIDYLNPHHVYPDTQAAPELGMEVKRDEKEINKMTDITREEAYKPLTPEEIVEAELLCHGATRGPWRIAPNHYAIDGKGTALFCAAGGKRNADFIVAARSLIPRLLAQVKALTAERDAAVRDLIHSDNCDICIHGQAQGCDLECLACGLVCACKDCRDEGNWQWRGPCADNTEGGPADDA